MILTIPTVRKEREREREREREKHRRLSETENGENQCSAQNPRIKPRQEP
jgi:hypothetical protein